MLLPHSGLNPAKEFGGKTSECDLAENMKNKFELVKELHGYSIMSITDPMVKIATQILFGKFMRKCHVEKVPTPVISLVAQCAEGVQFNWLHYLCSKLLANCHEAQDESKTFDYAWFFLSIVLVTWELPEDSQFPPLE